MLENENNGVHQNEINGNGAEPAKIVKPRKRVSTKDLSERIAHLENKIYALSDSAPASSELEQKLASLADQIAKLDERMSKIAQAVALMRGGIA